ncbi:DUF2163 domain-containing protein [Leeia aquatica]|uniref:DUF2163 domain-containing protein n=1 Tax=Leeia aquatica TaxID=2725557 RepID=A0A847S364_9NEIS|nr:DUF2163 domain-containing protein [Leeia aquatica]NLR74204.1 DUF2163 domain-containing protein [Leeia aquatica]
MKTASQPLLDLLNSQDAFCMADLFVFVLQGGQVLRYTSADTPVSWQGETYLSTGPGFKRGRTQLSLGVQVDTLEVTVFASVTDQINGQPFVAHAMRGGLDGANLTLSRAFLSRWDAPVVGVLSLFSGRVAEVSGTRGACHLQVKSDLELLNIKMPRNLYQPSCLHTVYDAGCAVSRASMVQTGSIVQVLDPNRFVVSLPRPAGWFDQGLITFSSGANAGISRTVRSYAEGQQVQIALPFPAAVQPGDAISMLPGCDKTQTTCQGKFNNLARFRGFPYIPVPETAA